MEVDILDHVKDLSPNIRVRQSMFVDTILVLRKLVNRGENESVKNLLRTGQHSVVVIEVTKDHLLSGCKFFVVGPCSEVPG